MANYECVIRTNYFHVKDEDQFRALMDVVSADSLEFWEKKDENGSPVFPVRSRRLSGILCGFEGKNC